MVECACTPIGLEGGDLKSLGGNQSACRFESDLAHSTILQCVLSKRKVEFDMEDISIYECKDGRVRVYLKDTQKVMSYPKYLIEKEYGIKLSDNEQVHHVDENTLNNDINNLEVLTAEEHHIIHAEENRRYFDKIMICPVCGKEFLWTAEQQKRFNGNIKRKERAHRNTTTPYCSKDCAGKYGIEVQKNNGVNIGLAKRKLTDEQVKYIRDNYVSGDKEFGCRALARKFGVNKSTINLIIKNKTYVNI